MTPRELSIMMSAQVERQYDELERLAFVAFMHEVAHRSKRLKVSDLFTRPTGEHEAQRRVETLKEKADSATEYLMQFTQFQPINGEEDENGE